MQTEDGDHTEITSEPPELAENESNLGVASIPPAATMNEVEIGPTPEEKHDANSEVAESNSQVLHERTEDFDIEWIRLIKERIRSYNIHEDDVEAEWIRLIKR